MEEQIRELVERHLTTLRREALVIDGDLRDLGDGTADLEGAVRRAHTLKGSSGNLGFAEVSREAETIERALRGIAEGRGAPDGEPQGANARLQRIAARMTARDSALYRRFS